jgi:hypothetical protein
MRTFLFFIQSKFSSCYNPNLLRLRLIIVFIHVDDVAVFLFYFIIYLLLGLQVDKNLYLLNEEKYA